MASVYEYAKITSDALGPTCGPDADEAKASLLQS
jgi:hypothetical protein